jgi:hypothetical protein
MHSETASMDNRRARARQLAASWSLAKFTFDRAKVLGAASEDVTGE